MIENKNSSSASNKLMGINSDSQAVSDNVSPPVPQSVPPPISPPVGPQPESAVFMHEVRCPVHGLRTIDLNGPEEMCADCQIIGPDGKPLGWEDGLSNSMREMSCHCGEHILLAGDTELVVKGILHNKDGFCRPIKVIPNLEPIEKLVQRWDITSRAMKEIYDDTPDLAENSSFRKSVYQRYVDYERRARELEATLKYGIEVWGWLHC